MQGLRSDSALFWACEKPRVRWPLLILSARLALGTPRMQGLRRYSALFWAPEKARVRWPIYYFSPRLAQGTPENAAVM